MITYQKVRNGTGELFVVESRVPVLTWPLAGLTTEGHSTAADSSSNSNSGTGRCLLYAIVGVGYGMPFAHLFKMCEVESTCTGGVLTYRD